MSRLAFHLANEYAVQRRVARASWNAKAALARQMVRGHTCSDDITDARSISVQVETDRVLVYISDTDRRATRRHCPRGWRPSSGSRPSARADERARSSSSRPPPTERRSPSCACITKIKNSGADLDQQLDTVLGLNMVAEPLFDALGEVVVGYYNNVSYNASLDNELNQAFVEAYTADLADVAAALDDLTFDSIVGEGTMRAEDHQLLSRRLPGTGGRDRRGDGIRDR